MSPPVLVTPQFDKPFILMADASDIGVDACIGAGRSQKFRSSYCIFLTEVQ